ncbi:MAG TPA: biosynthetic peptidoglycan transglycosylase [Gammaproteobacteria bacterium]|nr:biosynthetic peptidoglycan transglycosylase [Gammaproteobacteria bacterium]
MAIARFAQEGARPAGIRLAWRCLLSASVLLMLGIGTARAVRPFTAGLPSVDALRHYDFPHRLVPLSRFPPELRQAFLAAEDGEFWSEGPLDYDAIVRAALVDAVRGRPAQGGSTITQQVARMLFLHRHKTLRRKLRGAVLAYRLQRAWGKRRILDAYLNRVYLGPHIRGVTAASRYYFHRDPAQLDLAQAAMLAGLPANPSLFDPRSHPQRARARRDYVLQQMRVLGFISRRSERVASREPLLQAG